MMHAKPVIVAWLALIVLTTLSGMAADVTGHDHLGNLAIAMIGVATIAKARLILRAYLRLDTLPGMLAGLTVFAGVIVAVVAASLVIAS